MPNLDASWKFETARFCVAMIPLPEDDDPADHFEFREDIEAIRNGDLDWFCAKVAVFLKDNPDDPVHLWHEVAADYLGGCAYNSVREFVVSHRDPDPMNRNCSLMRAARGNVVICHYFPDMVHQAIAETRKRIGSLPRLRHA